MKFMRKPASVLPKSNFELEKLAGLHHIDKELIQNYCSEVNNLSGLPLTGKKHNVLRKQTPGLKSVLLLVLTGGVQCAHV